MELFYFFFNSNFKRNFLTLKDAEIDLKITKELPFQLKIIYDAGDGKYIRVLTQLKKLTEDKRVAENSKYLKKKLID